MERENDFEREQINDMKNNTGRSDKKMYKYFWKVIKFLFQFLHRYICFQKRKKRLRLNYIQWFCFFLPSGVEKGGFFCMR